ncbi:unnamed protein product, partial [Candidula unifasciata]
FLCDNQHYGHECESECHCSSNKSCFLNSGWCPNGCDEGYIGETCNTVAKKEEKMSPIVYTTILAVGGGLIFAAAAIICYACCRRKKSKTLPVEE